ncbi:MAG: hypothetical protein LBQ63_07295 [Deltaproteobacteria bacterium]|jgi:hypothetical protein|nr:hypothetical protein [Deltaproteobacteria bacterium]
MAYEFLAEMFKLAVIPKRLIPGAIWLSGITFTMDCFPGSPQIQNIIPTSFFNTDAYSAPFLGIVGGLFVFALGMAYFMRLQKKAAAAGETYSSGVELLQEPAPLDPRQKLPPWQIAIIPLVLVGVVNYLMTKYGVPNMFGKEYSLNFPGLKAPIDISVASHAGSLGRGNRHGRGHRLRHTPGVQTGNRELQGTFRCAYGSLSSSSFSYRRCSFPSARMPGKGLHPLLSCGMRPRAMCCPCPQGGASLPGPTSFGT